jgi:hypothetical protein
LRVEGRREKEIIGGRDGVWTSGEGARFALLGRGDGVDARRMNEKKTFGDIL